MTSSQGDSAHRLDSWKAIAAYLSRDESTVRRWEREHRLPVHRVGGGRGSSVFAYSAEIDEWLQTELPAQPVAGEARSGHRRWRLALAVAATIVSVGGFLTYQRLPRSVPVRVDASSLGVRAFGEDGAELWHLPFAATHKTILADGDGMPAQLIGGASPAVLVATSFRARNSDGLTESGTLSELTIDGQLKRSFEFTDRVTFGGTTYGPPWAITGFAVDDSSGSRRIAVAAHHHMWSPSVMTILDDRWERRGTFVHYGWIEAVRWLSPSRLLIAGFSSARDGGMVALLDPAALDGQSPEPRGSPHHCDDCASGAPLRMVVMPRTELNRITVSRFNRAVVQVMPDRIVARPIEVPSSGQDAVDSLYELTTELEVIRASFSARYWELHRTLEAQGQLNHSRDQCLDRDGPKTLTVWQPFHGWHSVAINSRPSEAGLPAHR